MFPKTGFLPACKREELEKILPSHAPLSIPSSVEACVLKDFNPENPELDEAERKDDTRVEKRRIDGTDEEASDNNE